MSHLSSIRPSILCLGLLLGASAFGASVSDVVATDKTYIKVGQESPSIAAAFDKDAETNITGTRTGAAIEIDFSRDVTEAKPLVYVSDVIVVNSGGRYSIKVSEDGTAWTDVPKAQDVAGDGTATHHVGLRILKVKYVFDFSTGADLYELTVRGFLTSVPVNVSKGKVARSITFRDGAGHRGDYGFNGGSYSRHMFDGNFTGGVYQNGAGAELVVPTTTPSLQPNDSTAMPWYVTEVKVGHLGNTKYSLTYTTEPEPTNILEFAKDPRQWTPIDGATGVQESGTKTYLVNKYATAVKYVFDTALNWTQSACEFEVWAMDPDDVPCTHPNLDLATAEWTVFKPATCTENAFEECFCPDCDERFEREVPLSKRGHGYVATLVRAGRHDRWGSGYVTCTNTLEDPDTHEITWSCDFRIDFDGEDVDLTTLGGPPINGVVQYTDLTVSSIGAQDGGIKAVYLMDGCWDNGWGHAFYFENCSSNEYAQYAFGTSIELTKIEFSVINEPQTVFLTKYDPDTGEETPLKTISVAKIVTFEDREDPETGEITQVNTSPGYQRITVDFFVTDKHKKTFVDAIRIRIGDYVDPATGRVTPYIGYNYGAHDRHTIICEIHPWGTIEGAGPLTHNPATIMLLR